MEIQIMINYIISYFNYFIEINILLLHIVQRYHTQLHEKL